MARANRDMQDGVSGWTGPRQYLGEAVLLEPGCGRDHGGQGCGAARANRVVDWTAPTIIDLIEETPKPALSKLGGLLQKNAQSPRVPPGRRGMEGRLAAIIASGETIERKGAAD